MQLETCQQSTLNSNSNRTERIAKQTSAKKKTAVVFATHKFIGQKKN